MTISVTNKVETVRESSQHNSANILITGDFCFDGRISDFIKNHDFESLFNDFTPFSKNADFAITNLECPLTERENFIRKAGPSLKGPPEATDALLFAGFNMVTLANNHIMDYGEEGLCDTLRALESKGIKHIGAGLKVHEAVAPLYLEIKDQKIALLNITEHEFSIATSEIGGASPLDEITNYYQIKDARKNADFLILIIHGGHELFSLPSPRMVKTYRFFADLGVDLIVGHHAHVFSGYEIYNGVPIFYNLGNFIFDRQTGHEAFHKGYAINFVLKSNKIVSIFLVPYVQCKEKIGVHLLKENEVDAFSALIKEYNSIITDPVKLEKEFSRFISKNRIHYLSVLAGLNKIQRQLLRMNILPGTIINNKKLLKKFNYIRCQAHRDSLIRVVKEELNIMN